MGTFTRYALYAVVGVCIALQQTAILAGMACILIIEAIFRPKSGGVIPRRDWLVEHEREAALRREREAQQAKASADLMRAQEELGLARAAVRRAMEQSALARMRES